MCQYGGENRLQAEKADSYVFLTKPFYQVVESETDNVEVANPEHRAKGKQLGGMETHSPGY